jgi:YegS/Rv2252/BmrU family lipid kinase
VIYRNAVLIFNPAAGKMLRDPGRLRPVLEALRGQGHAVREMPTAGPNQAAGLARRAIEEGADLILAAGGDGTINEVVEGIVGSRVPLGALPGGTANVLCMELGGSPSMRETARQFSGYEPMRIAVGRFTNGSGHSRHFLLMAGAGLDARIIHHLDAGVKRRFGKLAYWLGGFQAVTGVLPPLRVTVDGGGFEREVSFALVSRVRNYGGDLAIAPSIHLSEPEFEVVLFEGRSVARYVPYLAAILTRRLPGTAGVTIRRARCVEFQALADPVLAQVDGEAMGEIPARVEIVPDALTLLAPRDYIWNGQRHP